MKIKDQLIAARESTYSGTSACSTVTIHETANTSAGADAQAHANLQANNPRNASWHIQVDEKQAIRSYPDSVRCGHAGSKAKDSIAIEICVNRDGDYDKALANAANVAAQLLKAHGLDEMNVVGHTYWTGKNCPAQMLDSGRWDSFIYDVRANLRGDSSGGSSGGSSSKGKTPVAPDQGRWPEAYLSVASKHNKYTDRAWRDLMDRIDLDGDQLTASIQTWLRGLGHDAGPSDGDFGPRTTRALQSFLKDKGHYTGRIDGDRGPMTIRAEIEYLNAQAEIILNR